MLRKIGYSLLCAGALFSANSFATSPLPAPGVTLEYEFFPNTPRIIPNISFYDIQAVCTLTLEDESSEVFVEMLNKNGVVNGIPISSGESTSVIVHATEPLKIFAESAAIVRLTNRGEHSIKARCASV